MADECSFCAEWRSTAIVRDNVIWHILTAKSWTCALSEHFSKKSLPFLTNLPQSQIRRV